MMAFGYLFFFPPFPDLEEGPALDDADAASCFLVLPGCLGTNSATRSINCFPAIESAEEKNLDINKQNR